jgi:hypothetical protein
VAGGRWCGRWCASGPAGMQCSGRLVGGPEGQSPGGPAVWWACRVEEGGTAARQASGWWSSGPGWTASRRAGGWCGSAVLRGGGLVGRRQPACSFSVS